MRKKGLMFLLVPAAVMLITTMVPQEAMAQYYGSGYRGGNYGARPRWGFRHRVHGYVGGQIGGLIIAAQATDNTGVEFLGQGGGLGLFGGIRLGPFFALELDWAMTFHSEGKGAGAFVDSIYLMTIMANAKIHIPTRGPLEPYFQAGVGFAYIGASYADSCFDCSSYDAAFAKGPAFNIGGGLDFWVSPFFTIGGRLLYKGMAFSKTARSKDSDFINGVAVDLTGTFHF